MTKRSPGGLGFPVAAILALPLPVGVFMLARTWSGLQLAPQAHWLDALFAGSMAVATLVAMRKDLPWQNVLLAGFIILIAAAVAKVAGALALSLSDPHEYNSRTGPLIGTPPSWAEPLLWLVLLPNARGVARGILRSQRSSPNYGLWVLAVSVGLMVLFVPGLEAFAVSRGYRAASSTGHGPALFGLSWMAWCGYSITTLLLLILTTPVTIRKRPGPASLNLRHHYLWTLITAVLSINAALQKSWPALAVTMIALTAGFLAGWRGTHRPLPA